MEPRVRVGRGRGLRRRLHLRLFGVLAGLLFGWRGGRVALLLHRHSSFVIVRHSFIRSFVQRQPLQLTNPTMSAKDSNKAADPKLSEEQIKRMRQLLAEHSGKENP